MDKIVAIIIGVVVGIVLTTCTLRVTRVESDGADVDNALITIRIMGTKHLFAFGK